MQLQSIKDQGEKQLKELKNIDKSKMLKAIDEISRKNDEANKLLSEFRKIDETLDNAELVCTKTDGTKYNFNIFALPLKFIEKFHNYEITLDEAMDNQEKLEKLITRLENYNAKNKEKIDKKNKVLKSEVELFHARENVVDYFKKEIFPFKGNVFKTKEKKSEEKSGEKIEKSINDGIIFIKEKSKYINNDLFKRYFNFSAPIDLAKKLFETKDKKKNSELVEEIKNRWSNLKDEINCLKKK